MNSSDVGNFIGGVSFIASASSKHLENVLKRNFRGHTPISLIKTPKPLSNIKVSTNLLKNSSKVLKVGGNLAGGIGLGVTAYQYVNGEISREEATVDGIMGIAGFFWPFGTAASLLYFGGKLIYEGVSGETVFDKPAGN